MFDQFLNMDNLSPKQINEKILDLKMKIARSRNLGVNSSIIEAMQIQIDTLSEELYYRQEIKIFNKEKDNKEDPCVFDTEQYLKQNREKIEGASESTRKPNYKPGW